MNPLKKVLERGAEKPAVRITKAGKPILYQPKGFLDFVLFISCMAALNVGFIFGIYFGLAVGVIIVIVGYFADSSLNRLYPMYRASYKSNYTLPFGDTVAVAIDSKLQKKMSEEDTTRELLSIKPKAVDMFMWLVIGAVIGGLAAYFLMTGGLQGVI